MRVPLGRYAGNLKLVGNVELRSVFLRPSIGSQRFEIGPVAFFDTSRVWTSLEPNPELDGEGAGLKYGVGGGVRFQWGEAFLVRLDAGAFARRHRLLLRRESRVLKRGLADTLRSTA